MLLLVVVVVASIAADCPSSFPPAFSGAELAEVDPQCFASMRYEVLQTLPPSACSGFLSKQLEQLATAEPFSTCEGMSGACVSVIPDVSCLSAKCLARLQPAACASFSAKQLDSLKNAASLRPACAANIGAAQVKSVPKNTCC